MKKTSGAIPGPVGSSPTAPPTPAGSAAPSTPSGLSGLHPGDARHMIAAIRRSSGRSSGSQASLLFAFVFLASWPQWALCLFEAPWYCEEPLGALERRLASQWPSREFQLPSAPSTSPLAGRGERATENRGGSTPGRNAGQNAMERGGRVGQGGTADNEEEEEDNGPADGPVFPEVQRLLYRATDFLSSPVAPSHLPAQRRQHQTSGALDETAAATSGTMPTPPPNSHPPTPNHPPAPRPSAPSPAARLPKVVIKGHRAGPAATDRPAAAENQPPPGRKTVPSGDREAVAAASEERAATAQGPKRPTKIKVVSRPGSSLAPPRAGNGNSGGGDEEVEEAGDPAPSHGVPGGASAAARTGAAKVGRPRGKKGALASAPPFFGASQHQNQTLGLGEPGAAAGNTNAPAPKPKRKPRAKKDAPPPAGPPATSQPLAASSSPSGEAPKPRGRKPRAKKPSAAGAGPSTSAPGQPNNNRGRDEANFPPPAAPNRAAEQEAQGDEAHLDVLAGLSGGALVQPNQGSNGPSQGSPDQPSLDHRLADPDADNLHGNLPEAPHQADPGPEQLDAAPIDPTLEGPIPYIPLDPIVGLFPTVPVCFDANSLIARIWYPCNSQGEIDPHWETWPTRRNHPLIPGTGPCDPSDLRFEPDSTLPEVVHEDLQALARDGALFARTLESVNWAHAALDDCGYDFDRDPLRAPIPRAVRAALAGYRSFVFSRTGTNPFMGPDAPRFGAVAALPLGGVYGGGYGGSGMEYGDPADASRLGDGVVVGPALPRSIRDGSVFSRVENVLLIPAEWREGVTPRDEMGMGVEGVEKGRVEPDVAAAAASPIEDMPLEGPAYVDQPNDLDDDLYGNSQAGDIAEERRELEPEDDTAMDLDHPTDSEAAPQLANIPDRTRDLGHHLGNNQSGEFRRGQQVFERNDNTAMGAEHPIYPGAIPQRAIGGYDENNRFGFVAGGQRQFGPEDNAMLGQPIGLAQAGIDATAPGRPNRAAPGYHPNNLYQQSAAWNDHSIISDGQAAVVERQPVVFYEQPAVFNQQPAALNDNYPVPNDQDVAAEGYPANLNEQAAAFHHGFYYFDRQPAPIEDQPAPWNEQPVARNNNFFIENGQAARIEGQPAILNEQPVGFGYDRFAFNPHMRANNTEARPPVLNERPVAWNGHFVIENDQAAVIAREPSPLNYELLSLTDPAAGSEGRSGQLNNDFVISNDQTANNRAAAMRGHPGGMNYEFFDPNRGAAIENRPGIMNYDVFDGNPAAGMGRQPELANMNEHPFALGNYNGNAWPNFELTEAEWDAELEAFRLASGFEGNQASRHARRE
ncbi:hypothetical protein F5144DRAFT_661067 [Chaetomium tenue]|uniref:Uncharacterized protein n=1 Tax=Chaetomium tenue TaxID=1854479 RepID=A0ACB7NXR7_9PEZI|nr:hypothetical protein F5144DRAFT_661067 [Chaetomium globosum]